MGEVRLEHTMLPFATEQKFSKSGLKPDSRLVLFRCRFTSKALPEKPSSHNAA